MSAGFLDALGMRLVAGRGLQDTDDALAPKAMLINQAPEMLFGGPPMKFAVRTTDAPATYAPAILKSIRQLDPGMTMDHVATTSQLLSAALARSRLYAVLLGTFAAVALTLSALGLYAVLAYAVGQRTRELGVRRALGATHVDLAKLMIGQVLTLIIVGLGIGVLLAAVGTSALESLLFGVKPVDTATYVGAALAFGAVAVAAAVAPLKRAIRSDPMLTLRAA